MVVMVVTCKNLVSNAITLGYCYDCYLELKLPIIDDESKTNWHLLSCQ